MTIWLAILSLVLLGLLCLVRIATRPVAVLSRFERSRRVKLHDEAALLEQRRVRAEQTLWILRRIISVVLLLGLLWSLTMLLGIGWSVVIVIILVGLSGLLDGRANRLGARLYQKSESTVLKLAESRALRLLPVAKPKPADTVIHSTEELLHVLAHASFLDGRERELVAAAVDFPRLRVRDVMRQLSALKSIDKGEVLGPLVIDDLYKTGESIFLVIDGDIDAVVGLLPLEKLTGLELMGSPNALKAMDDTVEFIGEDEPVATALHTLRGSQALELIVQDANGHTVGALSLTDIIDRLFAES